MIRAIRLVRILVLCSLAVGSVQAQQRLGVAAEARLGASPLTGKPSVLITFTNASRHDVTAYNYSLRLDFADGSSRLDNRGTRFELSQLMGNQLFVAGTTRVEDLFELSDILKKDVTRVVATVDMVAYDDASAEVVNEEAFHRLVETRKAEAIAMERINEVFTQALSAKNPQQAALDGLKMLSDAYTPKDKAPNMQEAEMARELRYATQNIRRGSGTIPLEQFQSYAKFHGDRLALTKLHSNVRRIS
jgi:hypothetical protein